jgi:predicted dehydrogenase
MIGRRTFLELASGAALGAGCDAAAAFAQAPAPAPARIRLGLAGCGARGLALARMAGALPTCEIRAVADAYAGRRTRAAEVIGRDIPALDDARGLAVRDDIDALVIAVPDHLHAGLVEAALAANKDVWVESPVAHTVDETLRLRRVTTTRVVCAATGAYTSPSLSGARRLVQQGSLGRVVLVSGTWDTASSLHAWQFPFPPDASPESVNVAAFLGGRPARPFDAAQVFRWPAYSEFGSGLIGMRIVPMVAAVQAVLDLGAPLVVAASGGLHRWRDGRDTDDIVTATCEFDGGVTVVLGASLSGAGRPNELRFVGTEATLVVTPRRLELQAAPAHEPYPDVAETWPKGYRDWFYMMHGMSRDGLVRGVPDPERVVEVYDVPDGAGTSTAPLAEFLEAVRARGTVRESLSRGLAAGLAGQMVRLALRERRHVRHDEVAAA